MDIKGFQTKDGIKKVAFPDGTDIELDESLKVQGGVLSVNTTDKVEEDNGQPITSGAVYNEFSKALALLKTI